MNVSISEGSGWGYIIIVDSSPSHNFGRVVQVTDTVGYCPKHDTNIATLKAISKGVTTMRGLGNMRKDLGYSYTNVWRD